MRWLNLAEVLDLHSSLIQQSSCKEPGCCLTIESRAFHQANGANGFHCLIVNPQPPYYAREITALLSKPWPVLHQPMQQAPGDAGPGDFSIPPAQDLAAEGGKAHSFGEALTIHFAAQNPQLDQPDQMIFRAVGAEAAARDAAPVGSGGQLAAAEGALLQLLVEGQSKRQAAHRLAGAVDGLLGLAVGGGGDHALGSLAVILLLRTAA